MVRFYFMPATGSGASILDARRAKYADALRANGVHFSSIDYGILPVFFLAADVTLEQHAQIAAQSDVVAIPANLDNTVGAALSDVQTRLEQLRIPAEWVTAQHTHRQVIRRVLAWFLFAQRHNGLHHEKLFPDTANLDNTVGQLPQALRTRLNQTAQSFDMDTSAITPSTTIRQLMGIITSQLTPEIHIGSQVI